MNAFFSSNSIPLIALHGWGMNASVWQPIEALLFEKLPFLRLNLPGYSGNPALSEMTIDATVEWLADQFDGQCHLLGWSMGGLVAQAFCHKYPERVGSISLVASTPSFIEREHWGCGLDKSVLEQFIHQLRDNRNTTIRRFIALQFMGESGTTSLQKQLRGLLMDQPPNQETLEQGLQWLLNCDFREELRRLPPQHWMFGCLDRLVPLELSEQIMQMVPGAKVSYFDDCGHAPFLTQPEQFTEKLLDFIPLASK